MNGGEFATAAPELADRGWERFRTNELCMVGTLRAGGWPRISPCEPDVVDGELLLGMMWAPTEPFHLFAIEVMSAAYVVFGGDGYGIAWDPERGRWSQRPE